MATTKRRTASSRGTSRSRSSSGGNSTSDSRRSVTTRAGRVMRERPIATAALATGLVSGIAAAVAGFLAFKRSGKSFAEFSDDVATSVKDRAASARTRVQDGIADATARAREWSEPRRDGLDEERTQSEIAEEALTAKQIGKKTRRPVDPTIEEELKTGSISY